MEDQANVNLEDKDQMKDERERVDELDVMGVFVFGVVKKAYDRLVGFLKKR